MARWQEDSLRVSVTSWPQESGSVPPWLCGKEGLAPCASSLGGRDGPFSAPVAPWQKRTRSVRSESRWPRRSPSVPLWLRGKEDLLRALRVSVAATNRVRAAVALWQRRARSVPSKSRWPRWSLQCPCGSVARKDSLRALRVSVAATIPHCPCGSVAKEDLLRALRVSVAATKRFRAPGGPWQEDSLRPSTPLWQHASVALNTHA